MNTYKYMMFLFVAACVATGAFGKNVPVLQDVEDVAQLVREGELKYGDKVLFENKECTIDKVTVEENGDDDIFIRFTLKKPATYFNTTVGDDFVIFVCTKSQVQKGKKARTIGVESFYRSYSESGGIIMGSGFLCLSAGLIGILLKLR